MKKLHRATPAATLLAAVLAGCGGNAAKETAKPGMPPDPAAPPPQAAAAHDAGAAPSPTAGMPPLPKRDFQERDFTESDMSRDPFRGFATDLAAQSKRALIVQRKVLVDRYTLEELRLVGIIIASPSRALLLDPTGFGWIARVGDLVGKPELVHSGGPMGGDVPVNWHVDRIRQGDVVFMREDPSHPEIPPTTRVISLHPLDEAASSKIQGIWVAGKER